MYKIVKFNGNLSTLGACLETIYLTKTKNFFTESTVNKTKK